MTDDANALVSSLYPQFVKASENWNMSGLAPDDFAQTMALRVLERVAAEPSRMVVAQSAGYHIWDAYRNGAKAAVRHEVIYTKYVTSSSDEELDFFPAAEGSPEAAVEENETCTSILEAAGKLSPKAKIVLAMLYQGYSKREIASRLGISPEGVQHHLAQIRKTLSEYEL
jgi:RNA polymerase sigma factor (sigma-70 family)